MDYDEDPPDDHQDIRYDSSEPMLLDPIPPSKEGILASHAGGESTLLTELFSKW